MGYSFVAIIVFAEVSSSLRLTITYDDSSFEAMMRRGTQVFESRQFALVDVEIEMLDSSAFSSALRGRIAQAAEAPLAVARIGAIPPRPTEIEYKYGHECLIKSDNFDSGERGMGVKQSGWRNCARTREVESASNISTFGGGVRISRAALLAGASLIALAALGAPGTARACTGADQTISTVISGPIFSTGGTITSSAAELSHAARWASPLYRARSPRSASAARLMADWAAPGLWAARGY